MKKSTPQKPNCSPLKLILTSLALALLGGLPGALHAQGLLTPPGAPAPTMKTLEQIEPRTPISALPFNISFPGSYYITTNIVATNGQAGIAIYSGDVTLDLNGFTLKGTGTGTFLDGITVGGSYTNVVIRNGTIEGWGGEAVNGAEFGQVAQNMQVENVVISGNANGGISIGSGTIEHCLAMKNSANGFNITQGGVIENCDAENNGSTGIRGGSGVVVKDCHCFGNPSLGITVGPNSRISGCTVIATTNGTGITLAQGAVAENCLSISNQYGIFAQYGSTVSGCTVRACFVYGIQADSGTHILNNLVESVTGISFSTGIYLDGTNAVVDGCQVNNSQNGITALSANGATGDLIVRSCARGNVTAFNISATSMTGPILTYGSGAVAATGVITNTSPWANFAY